MTFETSAHVLWSSYSVINSETMRRVGGQYLPSAGLVSMISSSALPYSLQLHLTSASPYGICSQIKDLRRPASFRRQVSPSTPTFSRTPQPRHSSFNSTALLLLSTSTALILLSSSSSAFFIFSSNISFPVSPSYTLLSCFYSIQNEVPHILPLYLYTKAQPYWGQVMPHGGSYCL